LGREPDVVDCPALTCALAVQPDVIAGLAAEASFAARGFLARWLWSIPVSRVGSRCVGAEPVSPGVSQDYGEAVRRLWQGKATELQFSQAADLELAELERRLEPQLGRDGDLSAMCGWSNKLAGAAARIAGILHCAERSGDNWSVPVAAETVAA